MVSSVARLRFTLPSLTTRNTPTIFEQGVATRDQPTRLNLTLSMQRATHLTIRKNLDYAKMHMDARELTDRFLQSVDALVCHKDAKWSFVYLKTSHGTETRNGFLDACSELFVPFIGQPKPVIYEAVRDALRLRGDNWAVQRYSGMVLLNLVPDAYGQVDELI